jgi:hypothetical protein
MLLVLTPGLAWAADRYCSSGRHGSGRQAGSRAQLRRAGLRTAATMSLILGWGEDSLAVADELVAAGHEVVMTTLTRAVHRPRSAPACEVVPGDSTTARTSCWRPVCRDARLVIVAEDDPEQTSRIAETCAGCRRRRCWSAHAASRISSAWLTPGSYTS